MNMKLPIDWPRINQFPDWFTVIPETIYEVHDLTAKKKFSGSELNRGYNITLEPGIEHRLVVQ